MRSKNSRNHLICFNDPKSPIAEAYRTLRTNIQFTSFNKELRSIVVTSADPGEGKTTTIINLGIVMAQSDQKVLLVDADLRRPSIHYKLPLNNEIGLSNLLINQVEWEEAIQTPADVGFDVITSGPIPPNPVELINSKQMKELLVRLKTRYNMILIDTPPLLPVTDAQVLSSYVDGVLLVISSGKALGDRVKKAKGLLDHVGGKVIGTILNKKKVSDMSYY
ncbi:polysaccharide biosynthesis tyrosine autokinase [Brevibacillus fluminis]|uniref:non-specific protein-tyrosine kinase n=1 Tax=Brevibacillus fluminis TaxID=511487 RepID=A0A3M8DH53_9BACL|nr:CpsD/CapB family tyrosine-protein kinase [Brevibacillus fluminis]RNB87364.1 polysaccharide biosynthesis tyrosine autokinase [Brevibacillus fluminis]